MYVQTNVPLKNHSTMRLGGPADYFAQLTSRQDIEEAVAWSDAHHLELLVIGGGSNIIFTDSGFSGLVAQNKLPGFDIIHEDSQRVTIKIGAGEIWDQVVKRSVEMELYGIECLSAIPGSTGATPVQNVGAYGQEIADTFVELEAFDHHHKQWVTFDRANCQFGYRSSIFNTIQKHRYIITSLTLCLQKHVIEKPLYKALQNYLDQHHITARDPATLRQAVAAIRADKLPDPAKLPNTGSFFKNVILSKAAFAELQRTYPDIPHYPSTDGQEKIPAAWFLDRAGLKGYEAHGIRVNPAQPLVLINNSARSTEELFAMRDEIITKIRQQFGVTLVQEPETII